MCALHYMSKISNSHFHREGVNTTNMKNAVLGVKHQDLQKSQIPISVGGGVYHVISTEFLLPSSSLIVQQITEQSFMPAPFICIFLACIQHTPPTDPGGYTVLGSLVVNVCDTRASN